MAPPPPLVGDVGEGAPEEMVVAVVAVVAAVAAMVASAVPMAALARVAS